MTRSPDDVSRAQVPTTRFSVNVTLHDSRHSIHVPVPGPTPVNTRGRNTDRDRTRNPWVNQCIRTLDSTCVPVTHCAHVVLTSVVVFRTPVRSPRHRPRPPRLQSGTRMDGGDPERRCPVETLDGGSLSHTRVPVVVSVSHGPGSGTWVRVGPGVGDVQSLPI